MGADMRSAFFTASASIFLLLACARGAKFDPPEAQNDTKYPDPGSPVSSHDGGASRGPSKDAGAPDSAGGGSTSGDASASDDDAGASTSDASDRGLDCSDPTTEAECNTCCYKQHASGARTYDDAVRACACGAGGPCRTACANTFCADQPYDQGDACHRCLQNSPSCGSAGSKACNGDPDCVELRDCNDECGG
jgi:hypothetical protein